MLLPNKNVVFSSYMAMPDQKNIHVVNPCKLFEIKASNCFGCYIHWNCISIAPGGRTTHSRFKIPTPTLDNSLCNIEPKDDFADLLRQTQFINWDEAPMAHMHCFEALDRTLRDIMSNQPKFDNIFSGKIILFGGDFR